MSALERYRSFSDESWHPMTLLAVHTKGPVTPVILAIRRHSLGILFVSVVTAGSRLCIRLIFAAHTLTGCVLGGRRITAYDPLISH